MVEGLQKKAPCGLVRLPAQALIQKARHSLAQQVLLHPTAVSAECPLDLAEANAHFRIIETRLAAEPGQDIPPHFENLLLRLFASVKILRPETSRRILQAFLGRRETFLHFLKRGSFR